MTPEQLRSTSDMRVALSDQDADCLLATAEWALNHECGGLNDVSLAEFVRQIGGRTAVERAARKIESVADLKRQGIATDPDFPTAIVGLIPQPTRTQRVLDLLGKAFRR